MVSAFHYNFTVGLVAADVELAYIEKKISASRSMKTIYRRFYSNSVSLFFDNRWSDKDCYVAV